MIKDVCRERMAYPHLHSPETWLGWATSSGLGLDDLKAKLSRPLLQERDLLLAVSLLVVARTFVDVLVAKLQHPIDQKGELVGHRRDGLWGPEFGTKAAVLRPQIALALQEGRGRHP